MVAAGGDHKDISGTNPGDRLAMTETAALGKWVSVKICEKLDQVAISCGKSRLTSGWEWVRQTQGHKPAVTILMTGTNASCGIGPQLARLSDPHDSHDPKKHPLRPLPRCGAGALRAPFDSDSPPAAAGHPRCSRTHGAWTRSPPGRTSDLAFGREKSTGPFFDGKKVCLQFR